ncbi:MAG: N-6 DNA methylase [Phycisphaerae bacterium]
MNILQLKSLWKSEKEVFKEKELGALQNFVRKVLECVEFFNLEEGKESTAPHARKNVFIQEDTDSKASNRPDFVLYLEINQTQIKIPVEVEKHENIKAGEKQIKIYKDLYNAVYAILTDGNEWRFYDGDTVCQKLKLDEILDNPEIFTTFWKEYTLPETYYVSFFERMISKSLFDREGLEVELYREMFFDDITELIRNFKTKLRLSQYFNKEKDPDKVATEISYAYVIQYILYKTLVDNDYSDKKEEFLGRFKEVHKSLKAEIFGEVLTQATYIAEYISENLYRPFSAEQEYIEERLTEIKRQTRKSISDVSAWLDIFIFIKKYNFASVRNELFGYIYENYLKELYEDKNKGQYFTDPAVVEFMLDEIGYTTDEIKKRIKEKPDKPDISIIDPACGSGTFLYSAAQRIIDAIYKGDEKTAKQAENLISENIFGLDIAAFPLYLAEMGILMKMLPLIVNEKYNNPMEKKIKLFKTEDSIAEFVDMMHAISERDGQKEMFTGHRFEVSKFMRDEENLAEMKDSMRPPRRRFDFIIGNPPYIGYNECCKQEMKFTQLLKEKKLSMGNIYGVNLHSVPGRRKPYAPKPNLYSFFIALGLSLLKKNSKISYIIPQTILTAMDLDVLRYHLSKNTDIGRIVTFAGKMFIGRGLKQNKPVATSSLIFILNSTASENNKTWVISYENSQANNFYDCFNTTKSTKKQINQKELIANISNWNFINQDKTFIALYDYYNKFPEDLSIYYQHALSKIHFKTRFYFDKGLVFDRKDMTSKPADDTYQLAEASNNYKPCLTGKYVLGKDLTFPQGTQGIDVYNNQYKIIWSYTKLKFYFSDEKLMVGSNWLIISSENKNEILYLLTILNHPISNIILDTAINLGNEKLLIASIKSIKEFVNIPKITSDNQFIKDEVILRTAETIDLEDCQLQDFVDFSGITKQKFDNVEVRGNNLILTKDREEYKAPIKKKKDVVVSVLKEQIGDRNLLPSEIVLSELKYLQALDKELQKSLKDYIDDMVFALYFNVPVKKIGFDLADQIKELCCRNEFYDYIQKEFQDG